MFIWLIVWILNFFVKFYPIIFSAFFNYQRIQKIKVFNWKKLWNKQTIKKCFCVKIIPRCSLYSCCSFVVIFSQLFVRENVEMCDAFGYFLFISCVYNMYIYLNNNIGNTKNWRIEDKTISVREKWDEAKNTKHRKNSLTSPGKCFI